MRLGLGDSLRVIHDEIVRLFNLLQNKKQRKIYLSAIEPTQVEDNDVWIDMSDEMSPPVYNKDFSTDVLSIDMRVMSNLTSAYMDIDVNIARSIISNLFIDATVLDTANLIYKDINVDVFIGTNWELTSGGTEYERVYLNHFRAAYYGYFDTSLTYMQSDKYPPKPMGNIDSNKIIVGDKSCTILGLMGMYDERSTTGNGFNNFLSIYTEDGVIPFESLTLSVTHTFKVSKRTVSYQKTFLASEFTNDDVKIKKYIWPDETNGAEPKLFQILHDAYTYKEPVYFSFTTNTSTSAVSLFSLDTDLINTYSFISKEKFNPIKFSRSYGALSSEDISQCPIINSGNIIYFDGIFVYSKKEGYYYKYHIGILLNNKSKFSPFYLTIDDNPETTILVDALNIDIDDKYKVNLWKSILSTKNNIPFNIVFKEKK